MNKAELVSAISAKTGESKAKVGDIVDAMFDCITDCLKTGDEVRLPSFGVFAAVKTAPRKARNPQTNEEVVVPASTRARFKPGKALKDALERPNGGLRA
jgi:DNA-binding protein HU-beta